MSEVCWVRASAPSFANVPRIHGFAHEGTSEASSVDVWSSTPCGGDTAATSYWAASIDHTACGAVTTKVCTASSSNRYTRCVGDAAPGSVCKGCMSGLPHCPL